MRHQSITLTMDTYGHLFPGQEADAVGQMREMLVGPPEELRATGTDNAAVDDGQNQRSTRRSSQDAKRCAGGATRCDERTKPPAQEESPKPLQIKDLGDDVRRDAKDSESAPCRNRTYNLLIKSQLLCQLS